MLDDSNVQSRSMLLLLAGNPTNFHSLQTLLRFRNYSAAAAVSSLQHCAAEAVCSIAELCNTLCTSNCMLCAEQSQLTLQLYLKGKTVVCRVCQINWVTASTCSCCNHHPFCCCNHQPGSCCNHHHALSF